VKELKKYFVGVSKLSPLDGVYIGWEEVNEEARTKERAIKNHYTTSSFTRIDEPYRADFIEKWDMLTWTEVPIEAYREIQGYWKLKDELIWGRGE
jgi:hypothetical protein